jgi:hypothetical protein
MNIRVFIERIALLKTWVCHSCERLSPLRKQGQESIIYTGFWIPAPRFCGDKFTPAKAGAGMTDKSTSFQQSMKESKIRKRNKRRFSRLKIHKTQAANNRRRPSKMKG